MASVRLVTTSGSEGNSGRERWKGLLNEKKKKAISIERVLKKKLIENDDQ